MTGREGGTGRGGGALAGRGRSAYASPPSRPGLRPARLLAPASTSAAAYRPARPRAACYASPHSSPRAAAEESADASRPPTLVDKKMFAQNLYNISSEDLGKVVQLLDQRCEACIKKIDPEDIEIEIDAIDHASFWVAEEFVRNCLPGGKKGGAAAATKKAVAAVPKAASPAGAAAAGGSGAAFASQLHAPAPKASTPKA